MAKQNKKSQPEIATLSPEFPFDIKEIDRIHSEQCIRFYDKIAEVIEADKEISHTDVVVTLIAAVSSYVVRRVVSQEFAIHKMLESIESMRKQTK